MLTIRKIQSDDPAIISAAFNEQGWQKPILQFETYLQEVQIGQRVVLVAEWDSAFVGYVTIVWASDYPPFQVANIPEIVDFNVLERYQRRGIGTALMDEAERIIRERSNIAGIGVGLMHDYGKAQILYIKRGYIPDGRGLFLHRQWLKYGDSAQVDDSLTLYFTKKLSDSSLDNRYFLQSEIIRQTLSTPEHLLDTLLTKMRETGQSAIYLSGTRLDHEFGYISEDIGILLSVLPEDANKAATPGYHPGSVEVYFPFQGSIILEVLVNGDIIEKEVQAHEVYLLPAGQCHRVRAIPNQQTASLIVKTNLRHKPGVVRCEDCAYFSEPIKCLLFQRWKLNEL